jgi:hypothetical protein
MQAPWEEEFYDVRVGLDRRDTTNGMDVPHLSGYELDGICVFRLLFRQGLDCIAETCGLKRHIR